MVNKDNERLFTLIIRMKTIKFMKWRKAYSREIYIEMDDIKYIISYVVEKYLQWLYTTRKKRFEHRIMELYEIPLLRFMTNGSGEKEKIIEMLDKRIGQ